MSETVKPTIAALRAWLKTCPLIADEQEATGAAFRIAGLEEESTAGSPPHVRGKGRCHPARGWRSRITPAYAGKRSACSSSASGPPDHPRMCGEKISMEILVPYISGSPPRMRGKVLLRSSGDIREWDPPRVCGEKKPAGS